MLEMDDWLLLAGSNYGEVRRCCRTRIVGYETLDATSGECTDSLRRDECSYFLPLLAVCWPLMQTDTIENNHCLICKILHHSGVHFLFSSSYFIQHNTRLLGTMDESKNTNPSLSVVLVFGGFPGQRTEQQASKNLQSFSFSSTRFGLVCFLLLVGTSPTDFLRPQSGGLHFSLNTPKKHKDVQYCFAQHSWKIASASL